MSGMRHLCTGGDGLALKVAASCHSPAFQRLRRYQTAEGRPFGSLWTIDTGFYKYQVNRRLRGTAAALAANFGSNAPDKPDYHVENLPCDIRLSAARGGHLLRGMLYRRHRWSVPFMWRIADEHSKHPNRHRSRGYIHRRRLRCLRHLGFTRPSRRNRVMRFAGETKEKNLTLPAVRNILNQSKFSMYGFLLIGVGTALQIVGVFCGKSQM